MMLASRKLVEDGEVVPGGILEQLYIEVLKHHYLIRAKRFRLPGVISNAVYGLRYGGAGAVAQLREARTVGITHGDLITSKMQRL